MHKKKRTFSETLWDTWCCVSIIGLWPRYIEPNLISTTHLDLPIPNLPPELESLKIVQISDLHLQPDVSQKFLDKLKRKVRALNPDILVFTGDFLCYGKILDPERLRELLMDLPAKYGRYAILGNHDYARAVSISPMGDYDIVDPAASTVNRGFGHLLKKRKITGSMNPRVNEVGFHPELNALLKQTSFDLLHNETRFVPIKGTGLNICGLGEYMLGRCLPDQAYEGYRSDYPGIILVHNPDGIKTLRGRPGEVILSGHTHGGQVNLPWMWKRFVVLENPAVRRGLYHLDDKWVYVNRGIGSVMKFRWFAIPELLSITLKRKIS